MICRRAVYSLLSILYLQISFDGLFSQTEKPITIEWMHSPERYAIQSVPDFTWLDDGSAILYDKYGPGRQGFEKLNPKTGHKTLILDLRKASDDLRSLLDSEFMPALRWPEEFTHDGRRAVYVINGDIFLLDMAKQSFVRVTRTGSEEKSVRFAPDGNKMAYVRDNDLYVYDLDSLSEYRLTTDGGGTKLNGTLGWLYWEEIYDRQDIGYWWAPDSRSVAFLQTDESKVSVVHFQDFKEAVPQLTEQRYPKAGGINPSLRIGIADLHGRSTQWIDLERIPHEYIVRVQWLPSAASLSFQTLNRAQTELNLHFYDRSAGTSHRILTEYDTAWVNPNYDLYFSPSGKFFLWTSERDGYAHLYRYSMKGELLNRITSGAWSLRPAGGEKHCVVAVDEKSGWVYVTAQEKHHTERHVYRVRLDGTKLKRMSDEAGTHEVHFSGDAAYYFDIFSDMDTPPGLWLGKADGKILRALQEPKTGMMQPFFLNETQMITIPARDGFPLPARIIKPRGFDPSKKYPVILHTYGGPGAPVVANEWEKKYFWFHQMLANEGYYIVYIDNRSATGISKTLENQVVLHQAGDHELNDWVDAARWLKNQSYVDSSRLGLWGWSGGGTATLLCMTRSQEFKAGIAVGAVTDWKYYDSKYSETTMKTPVLNPHGYAATSLLPYARDLHGRLLLVHGLSDDNVHPQNMLAFADKLIEAGIRFDLMVYPGRKHGISDLPGRNHLFHMMLDFWKERL